MLCTNTLEGCVGICAPSAPISHDPNAFPGRNRDPQLGRQRGPSAPPHLPTPATEGPSAPRQAWGLPPVPPPWTPGVISGVLCVPAQVHPRPAPTPPPLLLPPACMSPHPMWGRRGSLSSRPLPTPALPHPLFLPEQPEAGAAPPASKASAGDKAGAAQPPDRGGCWLSQAPWPWTQGLACCRTSGRSLQGHGGSPPAASPQKALVQVPEGSGLFWGRVVIH